jgi:hypothetical protein
MAIAAGVLSGIIIIGAGYAIYKELTTPVAVTASPDGGAPQ